VALRNARAYIFYHVKVQFTKQLLRRSQTFLRPADDDLIGDHNIQEMFWPHAQQVRTGLETIDVRRKEALEASVDTRLSKEARRSQLLFGQSGVQQFFGDHANLRLRCSYIGVRWPGGPLDVQKRTFIVNLVSEMGQDAGGPYRVVFDDWLKEVQPLQVEGAKKGKFVNLWPLFLPSPNRATAALTNNATNVVNTRCARWDLYRRLGKMMGAALRSEIYLPAEFSSTIWKQLCHESATLTDLDAEDCMAVQQIARSTSAAALCEQFGTQTFQVRDSHGDLVQLCPGGRDRRVTAQNYGEFLRLYKRTRLTACRPQVQALLSGMSRIVPLDTFSLFSGAEIREYFCGPGDYSVADLRQRTEYKGIDEQSNAVQFFWREMEQLSRTERASFLNFVTGCSRYRRGMKLVIVPLPNHPANGCPNSATCFNELKLCKYTDCAAFKKSFHLALNCASSFMEEV
jgi:hypothetical protein